MRGPLTRRLGAVTRALLATSVALVLLPTVSACTSYIATETDSPRGGPVPWWFQANFDVFGAYSGNVAFHVRVDGPEEFDEWTDYGHWAEFSYDDYLETPGNYVIQIECHYTNGGYDGYDRLDVTLTGRDRGGWDDDFSPRDSSTPSLGFGWMVVGLVGFSLALPRRQK